MSRRCEYCEAVGTSGGDRCRNCGAAYRSKFQDFVAGTGRQDTPETRAVFETLMFEAHWNRIVRARQRQPWIYPAGP